MDHIVSTWLKTSQAHLFWRKLSSENSVVLFCFYIGACYINSNFYDLHGHYAVSCSDAKQSGCTEGWRLCLTFCLQSLCHWIFLQKERWEDEWLEVHLPLKTHLRKGSLAPPIISFALGSGALCEFAGQSWVRKKPLTVWPQCCSTLPLTWWSRGCRFKEGPA